MSEHHSHEPFSNITEQPSAFNGLEKMTPLELLTHINDEDRTVAEAVRLAIPAIEPLVRLIADQLLAGGRLFYLGAGTSGRLGVLDASEIPPTYGMPDGVVIGIIAGGDEALRHPIENAEDNREQGWKDLSAHNVTARDVVIGIASSGRTPYVEGALKSCREAGIATGCVVCNPGSPISFFSDFPVEVIVGSEFVTGSTRMKSGTAQKMVLNMISTSVMILIGRVEGNQMVNMQLTNAKLIERGTKMVMQQTGIEDEQKARDLLITFGSVKKAIESTYS